MFFGIFCLSIKEYEKSEHNLWFEVHFERIYIAQIRYGIKGGMSFSNEYVNMGDGCHGVAMGTVNNTADLLKNIHQYVLRQFIETSQLYSFI